MGKMLQVVIFGVVLLPGTTHPAQRASDSQKTYFSALQCPISQGQSGTVNLCADSALVLAGGYFLYKCLQSPYPFFSTYTAVLGAQCAIAGLLCRAFIAHVFEDKEGLKPTRP